MSRLALTSLALASLAVAALSQAFGDGAPFTAHMSAHMIVVALAAPLLALATTESSLDAVPRAPRLFAPITASLVEFAVVWVWHAPSLHHAARHHPSWLAVEYATFFVASFALWISSLGAGRDDRRGVGVIALLLTSMHMTLLGALIALSPRALYASCAGGATLTTLDDQHLGGAVMIVFGGVSYLVGATALASTLLRDGERA